MSDSLTAQLKAARDLARSLVASHDGRYIATVKGYERPVGKESSRERRLAAALNPPPAPTIGLHHRKFLREQTERFDKARKSVRLAEEAAMTAAKLMSFIDGNGPMPKDVEPHVATAARVLREHGQRGISVKHITSAGRDILAGLDREIRESANVVERCASASDLASARQLSHVFESSAKAATGTRREEPYLSMALKAAADFHQKSLAFSQNHLAEHRKSGNHAAKAAAGLRSMEISVSDLLPRGTR